MSDIKLDWIFHHIESAILECQHFNGSWLTVIMLAALRQERVALQAETKALERAVEYTGPLESVCPVRKCPLNYRGHCNKNNSNWKDCLLGYFRGEK